MFSHAITSCCLNMQKNEENDDDEEEKVYVYALKKNIRRKCDCVENKRAIDDMNT